MDHLAMNVREATIDAIMAESELFVGQLPAGEDALKLAGRFREMGPQITSQKFIPS